MSTSWGQSRDLHSSPTVLLTDFAPARPRPGQLLHAPYILGRHTWVGNLRRFDARWSVANDHRLKAWFHLTRFHSLGKRSAQRISKPLLSLSTMPGALETVICSSHDLSLPRILCLHGGGSNARIFRAQCRALEKALRNHFRLIYVDAPFISQAGPCVMSVYSDWGPYRRWLRWTDDHPPVDARRASEAVDKSLRLAMDRDDALGATGEWVAVIGFSQGAKIAASLLFRQQQQQQQAANALFESETERVTLHEELRHQNKRHVVVSTTEIPTTTIPTFRFGVILAGRGPLVALDPEHASSTGLPDAAALSGVQCGGERWNGQHVLHIPTIHVHGLEDPGLEFHRLLRDEFCDEGSARLVEWDGGHRVPIKKKDVEAVVEHIMNLAREARVVKGWDCL